MLGRNGEPGGSQNCTFGGPGGSPGGAPGGGGQKQLFLAIWGPKQSRLIRGGIFPISNRKGFFALSSCPSFFLKKTRSIWLQPTEQGSKTSEIRSFRSGENSPQGHQTLPNFASLQFNQSLIRGPGAVLAVLALLGTPPSRGGLGPPPGGAPGGPRGRVLDPYRVPPCRGPGPPRGGSGTPRGVWKRTPRSGGLGPPWRGVWKRTPRSGILGPPPGGGSGNRTSQDSARTPKSCDFWKPRPPPKSAKSPEFGPKLAPYPYIYAKGAQNPVFTSFLENNSHKHPPLATPFQYFSQILPQHVLW